MDIELADAYVNQQNKYRYLSIDCSGIGGVEQIYLYETVLEDDFRQEEPARITYYSETDQSMKLGKLLFHADMMR
jgi:hypothetical protein